MMEYSIGPHSSDSKQLPSAALYSYHQQKSNSTYKILKSKSSINAHENHKSYLTAIIDHRPWWRQLKAQSQQDKLHRIGHL
jgi:cobyrinic acid a,c-diamide synthase